MTFNQFIFIAKGEAGNPFLGGTDPYFRGTIDWDRTDMEHQCAEGLRRIREGLRSEPLLGIKWMTIGKLQVFLKTMWVGPYLFSVPAWYMTMLTHLHTLLIAAGSFTMVVFSARKTSLQYIALAFLIFLSVHMLFIPVDRYVYGMLPFLMLASAYLITQVIYLIRNAVTTSRLQRRGI